MENVAHMLDGHITVATPGRAVDVLQRRPEIGQGIGLIVLDECDELLKQAARGSSFIESVRKVFAAVPQNSQVALFSATVDENVVQLSSHFMSRPVIFQKQNQDLRVQGISQYSVHTAEDVDKLCKLREMFSQIAVRSTIIFCATTERVDWLSNQLETGGHQVGRIHSKRSDSERRDEVAKFRAGTNRILVSTSLLARGLDVQTVQVVVMFDIVKDPETYLHASGRSGRFGRQGVSIVFIAPRDHSLLDEILIRYKMDVKPLPLDWYSIL